MAYTDDSEDESRDSDSGGDYGGDFADAISEAFPDEDWSEERLAAMKEAIRLCVERDTGEESEKKPGTLALIFGGKPKK
jgi:ribosome-binding protein aMBF1 (putative translation factor)